MTEKAVEGKKGKAQVPVAKPGANVKAKEAPKGSNGSSSEKKSSNSSSENGSNGDHPERAHEKKGPPSAEDLERYKKYVGQKWTGRCRWFNVMKGFGFIDPHFEEAKSNNDDVFVHQSALQMEGFRSLDENEEVEFVVSLGRNGLEAAEVQGIDGATLRGHSIRPMGRKNRERLIRCFKCGKLGHHQASRCKVEIAPKACYQCHSTEHQVSNCPTYLARKEAQAEGKSSRPSKSGQKPAANFGNIFSIAPFSMSSSSFRSELISICLRVGAAAVISYVSIKYMVKFLDPNYQLKQEAKKKVEELLQRLDIDFPLELNEYELRIATQLVPPDQGVSWNEVGGYENVINDLKNRVIKPLQARANNRLPAGSSLLTPAHGILLYGPPGCGKTLIAKAMARSARARFIQLDISCLTDKWYGESQKLAAAVFSLAQKLQPCIVFIDEVDAFLRRRDSCDNEATAMMKAQFMSLWDGFSSGDNAVIIMGATNRPNDVDAAILRRMPIKFHVQLPNETAREAIFETILRNEYVEPDVNYKKLAKLTHGHSGSDLKEICRIAAMSRLNDADGSDVEWIEPAAITIREEDLVQAVVKYSSDTLPPTFNQLFIDEVE